MECHWDTRFCTCTVLKSSSPHLFGTVDLLQFLLCSFTTRSQFSRLSTLSLFCTTILSTAMIMSWCLVSPWRTWIKPRGWLLASPLWPTPWPSLLSQRRYDPQHAYCSVCTDGPTFSCRLLPNRASFVWFLLKVSFQARLCTHITWGLAACSEVIK